MQDIVDVSRIRALNDDLRRSLAGGVLRMTKGVIALGRAKQIAILDTVAAFDSFDADNDPYGEGGLRGAASRGRAAALQNRVLRPKPDWPLA